MTLYEKTLVIILSTLLAMLALMYGLFNFILFNNIKNQEEQSARENLNMATKAIQNELSDLETMTIDWGAWDEMYNFVQNPDPTWAKSNLGIENLSSVRFNLVAVLDKSGNPVFTRAIDLQNPTEQKFPPDLIPSLVQSPGLLAFKDSKSVHGALLQLPEGILLVATHPITTADFTGDSLGSIVLGRYLNDNEIQHLSGSYHFEIQLFPTAYTPLSLKDSGLQFSASQSQLSFPLSEQTYAAYTRINDTDGQPMLLEIRFPRLAYHQARNDLRNFLLFLTFALLLFGWMMTRLLKHSVLDRIKRIEAGIFTIQRERNLDKRLKLNGNDELNHLTGEINGMLDAIQQSQAMREESEKRFRQLVELSPDAILVHVEGRILYANPAGYKMVGAVDESEVIGRPITHFIHPDDRDRVEERMQSIRPDTGSLPFVVERYIRLDGKIIDVEVAVSPVKYNGRDAIQLIVHDLSLRKQLTEEEQFQSVLAQLSVVAANALDFTDTMQNLADQLGKIMHADGCYLTLWDEARSLTIPVAAYGPFRENYSKIQTQPGMKSMTAALVQHGKTLVAEDVHHSEYIDPDISAQFPAVSMIGIPLIIGKRILGAALLGYDEYHVFSDVEIDRAERTVGPVALAVSKALLFDELKRSNAELADAYDSTIEGWSRALELRDHETEGHSKRVTEMTVALARRFGIPEEEVTHIRRGSLLHDIGKMGVPDSILLKPAGLTEEERAVIGQHPIFAYRMLSPIQFLDKAIEIPYCHHEKWDGSGYPQGLQGENIPFSARLFSIIDVWDALNSNRPYHPPWPLEAIITYIREQSGKHFDPQVADVFLDMVYEDIQPEMAALPLSAG